MLTMMYHRRGNPSRLGGGEGGEGGVEIDANLKIKGIEIELE